MLLEKNFKNLQYKAWMPGCLWVLRKKIFKNHDFIFFSILKNFLQTLYVLGINPLNFNHCRPISPKTKNLYQCPRFFFKTLQFKIWMSLEKMRLKSGRISWVKNFKNRINFALLILKIFFFDYRPACLWKKSFKI